jgi:hypothetical protein
LKIDGRISHMLHQNLWQTVLHKAARREDSKMVTHKGLAGPVTLIQVVRNRMAHHKPIINWSLSKHQGNIEQSTTWLSPSAVEWLCQHSRISGRLSWTWVSAWIPRRLSDISTLVLILEQRRW